MRISDWSSDVCSSDLISSDSVRMRHEKSRSASVSGAVGSTTSMRVAASRGDGATTRTYLSTSPVSAMIASKIESHHIQCDRRSEEHTSELQSLMRISYAVFCLKKKKIHRKM